MVTFRKIKRRACGDPYCYQIMVDGQSARNIQSTQGGYFWYGNPNGIRVNTASSPKSLEECKVEVKEAFKEVPRAE